MVYETLLAIGGLGIAAQSLLGFSHGGHAGNGNHAHVGGVHGGTGHSGTIATHAPTAHAPGIHVGQTQTNPSTARMPVQGHTEAAQTVRIQHEPVGQRMVSEGAGFLMGLLSPLALFSICLGAGAAGLLLQAHLSPLLTALLAGAGGLFLHAAVVKPLWAVIFRFASQPARALAGTVATSAEAMSRFDHEGRGIVRVTIDGQVVRLLASLESDDQANGVTVVPGDTLLVTSVDGQKNTCRVTPLS